MFVNLALEAMERAPGTPAAGANTLLCLDEFAVLGHMRQVEEAAGQIAGFGVTLWVILQDLGQLKALYKERWETFLGNAGILQCFGNTDMTTLEYLSRRLGKTSMIIERTSQTTTATIAAGGGGKSLSNEVHDLMTAEELARFFSRQARAVLVIYPGWHPMALERVEYFRHEEFEERFDSPR